MNYLEALFKDIGVDSKKTNKIRRKALAKKFWIEAGEHGKMIRNHGTIGKYMNLILRW